jgi:hypothetical protein
MKLIFHHYIKITTKLTNFMDTRTVYHATVAEELLN